MPQRGGPQQPPLQRLGPTPEQVLRAQVDANRPNQAAPQQAAPTVAQRFRGAMPVGGALANAQRRDDGAPGAA
jgi:hypothetical protein